MSDHLSPENRKQTLSIGFRDVLFAGFLAGSIALSGQWLVGQI